MTRYFRHVPDSNRLEMAAKVREWGYPREIVEADEEASWVSWGDDVLAWFQMVNPQVATFHVCSHPDTRAGPQLASERTRVALDVYAELMGAEFLAAGFDDKLPGHPEMRRYAVSRGWTEYEWGCGRPLGSRED